MEANEAPEKIYLTPLECMAASCQPKKDNTIEYTRTDAFVEKSCEFLDPVLKNYAGYYVGKAILEGFKKYMEGV